VLGRLAIDQKSETLLEAQGGDVGLPLLFIEDSYCAPTSLPVAPAAHRD
jgi:hypothetical protein